MDETRGMSVHKGGAKDYCDIVTNEEMREIVRILFTPVTIFFFVPNGCLLTHTKV